MTAPAVAAPAMGSPEWWLRRLHVKLAARQPEVELFGDYYCGDHPLPWVPPRARDLFRHMLRLARANVMGLVIDATAERLAVEGFRMPGQDGADADTWRIWQANGLDSDFDLGILEALKAGTAYTLVQPNDTDTPDVFIEHPSQAFVDYVPGSNRRRKAASLKLWIDDWTGLLCATVDDGSWLYKFQAPKPTGQLDPTRVTWERREVVGEDWPVRNPLGAVAMSELPNNPQLLTGGRSEIADVITDQDRINKTLADRMMTQDFGLFPQKWATGFPDDGTPVELGPDRMVTTDVAETRFGQFTPADLAPLIEAKVQDTRDIAARTRTPAQYLLGEMSNVNGETLKASESGLVSKVRQRQRSFGQGALETVKLIRRAAGLEVPAEPMAVIWRNPEFRTEGETMDAAVKGLQSGMYDVRYAREYVGMSQTAIAQVEQREAVLDPAAAAAIREFNASAGVTGAGSAGV